MSHSIKISILLLFISLASIAQHTSSRIDSLLASIHSENPEVSISVGLIQSGNTSFFNLGGTSRGENAPLVMEYDIWEIASITKALTGNLLAQAVQEGKIKLEDYIEVYLPKSYKLKENIRNTIHISDLASHQSGLIDIDFPALIAANSQQPTAQVMPSDIINLTNNCDSLLDYGQYRYSTLGLVLLGQILEEVYGMPYEALFQMKISSELGFQNTKITDFDPKGIVVGYNTEGGQQEPFEWSFLAPAGLVKSSSIDMISYLDAILTNGNAISDAAKLQEKPFYQDEKIELGLAINIIKIESNTLFGKTGDTMGQSSVMIYDREKELGIVIFVNERNSTLRNMIFNGMYKILY